ncbi:MAG: NUDIX domain-containing protein [Rhodospirillales bacterium]|nr:NUDIX domain-containing protein [Rhodospirillales bacterium]
MGRKAAVTGEPTGQSRDYPSRPFVGVGVVVLRGEDVLLIRRGKPPRLGGWSLPGGCQETGETVHEAARREIMEETGVAIEVLGLVDVVDSIQKDADGRVRQHYTLIDVGAAWRGGKPKAGGDALAAEWVPVADISTLGLWTETERVIRKAVALWGGIQAKPSPPRKRGSRTSRKTGFPRTRE